MNIQPLLGLLAVVASGTIVAAIILEIVCVL